MKHIITELKPAFSANRCGAQFELTLEGREDWVALIGGEAMPKQKAHRLAHDIATLLECAELYQDLHAKSIKMQAFLDDLSKSNPGYMSRLVLQDYLRWAEVTAEFPHVLKKLGELKKTCLNSRR